MARCSVSLVSKEMQIKIIRYPFTHTKIDRILKRQKMTSVGKGLEKLELSYTTSTTPVEHSLAVPQ